MKFLPSNLHIIGYARSKIELGDFRKRITSKIKIRNDEDAILIKAFVELCTYQSGSYNEQVGYQTLHRICEEIENGFTLKDRIFYMALPPSVFAAASHGLKNNVYSTNGTNRIIVEKPFGKDSDSSRQLSVTLAASWAEEEIYRIDHYLGKEMITFKETIGTQGRGGYFDEFGIIRDVMQNHLLQILTIVAMERPVSLAAEDIRNEKVKVLRTISSLKLEDILLGQYTASADGKEPGYLEDPTVPKGSLAATFAAAVFRINNERWDGVPFILKCGKALDQQKTEIRIQFRDVPGNIYPQLDRNELVVRVQPHEAVYMKMMNKSPGLNNSAIVSELDLSYRKRYEDIQIPDAYESLILDCLRGDKSNFVRDDELEAAWKIFTPVLHEIETKKITPEPYVFGSRGPENLNQFIENQGYMRQENYVWSSKI